LSTTLLVCPHVRAWQDFDVFSEWIGGGFGAGSSELDALEEVSLVAFHPDFLRWNSLPEGAGAGSAVRAHWTGKEEGVFPPPLRLKPAELLELDPAVVGVRHLSVRFGDGVRMVVPWEWVVPPEGTSPGPPLPDNAMHRAPHPTVHLIRAEDLDAVPDHESDEVQLANHRRLAELGPRVLQGCPLGT